jgi:hypothetical protein
MWRIYSNPATSRCCTILNQHRVNIVILCSCLHRNVVRYRINIVSTLWTFLIVYIVHIVDIAMLYDIESTSCRHCEPCFLFKSFTSSTSRCWTILNQHCVDIVNLSYCLHRSHRRHRDVEGIELTPCRHCESFLLFTSLTSLTLQWWTISMNTDINIQVIITTM